MYGLVSEKPTDCISVHVACWNAKLFRRGLGKLEFNVLYSESDEVKTEAV
jgi:hypothetical protein